MWSVLHKRGRNEHLPCLVTSGTFYWNIMFKKGGGKGFFSLKQYLGIVKLLASILQSYCNYLKCCLCEKGVSSYNLIHSIYVKAFYLASKRVYYFTTKFHYVPDEFCLMELNFTLSNYLLEQTIFTE